MSLVPRLCLDVLLALAGARAGFLGWRVLTARQPLPLASREVVEAALWSFIAWSVVCRGLAFP